MSGVLRPGQVIFLCVLALLIIGVVMVSSAGMNVDPVEVLPVGAGSPGDIGGVERTVWSIIASRPAIYMVLALIALGLASAAPLGRLASLTAPDGSGRRAHAILAIGVLVLLAVLATAFIPGLGREVNGSRRWIWVGLPGLGKTSIQPSELAKWGLIPLLAWYGAARGAAMAGFRNGLAPALAAAGIVAGAVALEDLGTGVLIGAVGCLVLIGAGARVWHFLAFIPVAAGALALAVMTSPYRLQRLVTFLDPYADPQGAGYHMIQSMLAVAGGEGPGRGLGHGLQKFGYLPEDRTDFLFAVLCEELGIAGAAVVIALFIALLWAGLAVVRRERSSVLKLVGLGIVSTVGMQALINLAVVTGLGPAKGIALPLVSAGGTGWILTAASLGLLIAMDRAGASGAAPAEGVGRAMGLIEPSPVVEAGTLAAR